MSGRAGPFGKFLVENYVPFLAKRPVQVVIIAFFLVMDLSHLYLGVFESTFGMENTDAMPDVSYLRDCFLKEDDYGLSHGNDIADFNIYFKNVEYWTFEGQQQLNETLEL